jgi:K+ transporter
LSDVASDTITRPTNTASLSFLGLSALGVVFGDIGTSPLYTLKTVLGLAGGTPDAAATLGVLSLVVWTLIVEIAIFVPLILLGVGRLGAHLLSKVEEDEDAYFILMLAILAVAGILAASINLPGIVADILRIPGGCEARIVPLAILSNAKSRAACTAGGQNAN